MNDKELDVFFIFHKKFLKNINGLSFDRTTIKTTK